MVRCLFDGLWFVVLGFRFEVVSCWY